jgi:hypothetical protein
MSLDTNLEALVRPLGHIVIEFAYLEIDLGRLITRIARADDLLGAILASMPFSAKVDTIRRLAEQRLGGEDRAEDRSKLEELLERAVKLNTKRNKFIHGEFLPVVDVHEKYVGMMHRTVKNPNKPFEDVKPKTLEDLALDVRSVANDIRMFSATVHDLFPD